MKISILIPCYNEELNIERCIFSCLNQTRPPDEIIIVNDSSTDNTLNIIKKFTKPVRVVTTPYNMGNKSYAQEYGLQFITGDIFITTDGDTFLDSKFVERIEKDMENNHFAAVAGYVRSIKYNWVTACRALDYVIGQNIDKLAAYYLNFILVVPGAAGAFRTSIFKNEIKFTHDTLTEDLDFTYILNYLGYKIKYDRKAICYTQDPITLKSYINQMRRWYAGGWQNLVKHFRVPNKPGMAFELILTYLDGLLFSFLIFLMPIISIYMTLWFWGIYSIIIFAFCVYASIVERRSEFLFALPSYAFLKFINAWVFLEEFFKEVVFKKKEITWYKPERVKINGLE